ncbi:MAG: SPOR domain-containing protein [candidate division WOR-3 bacterium]
MKKLLIMGVIILFVFCAPKKTTVKTEGLEEVVVFGEEGKNISEEPVYPTPAPAPEISAPPTEAPALPPAIEEAPAPMEEVTVAPPAPAPLAPLPMEEVTAVPLTPTPAPTYTPAPTPSAAPASVYGFRVQIFASSTQKGASKVAEDARSIFGGKVYIEHTPPYYKVRVGDCLTKEEAESLKNLAISKGYRGAFVVETMINP